jgi:hemoglobin-like flavoprotein
MATAALKASWGKVVAAGDDVPLYFYSHLFLSHPELRSMFPIQMSAQRDKLVAALGAVVSNVDEIDSVIPLLEQLGRDHRRFSVVTEHYDAVGASLLATLNHFLARSWTPELADTWAQAYGEGTPPQVEASCPWGRLITSAAIRSSQVRSRAIAMPISTSSP